MHWHQHLSFSQVLEVCLLEMVQPDNFLASQADILRDSSHIPPPREGGTCNRALRTSAWEAIQFLCQHIFITNVCFCKYGLKVEPVVEPRQQCITWPCLRRAKISNLCGSVIKASDGCYRGWRFKSSLGMWIFNLSFSLLSSKKLIKWVINF